MYADVLLVHSWFRYIVLGLGLWLLITIVQGLLEGRPWARVDERLHVAFLAALDAQLLLGLSLYFLLSPISAQALADLGAAMKDPPLRFFGVEHSATMLLAVIIAHVGRVLSKRKSSTARYRTLLWTQLLWALLTFAAIPWPMLDVGRPLFRM